MKRLVPFVLLATAAWATPHSVQVTGSRQRQTVRTDGGSLTVTGEGNVIQVEGAVDEVNVVGSRNQVTCQGPFQSLLLTGSDNLFRWKDGSAVRVALCTVTGSRNRVEPPLPGSSAPSARPALPVERPQDRETERPALPVGPLLGTAAFFVGVVLLIVGVARWSRNRVQAQMVADAHHPERLWCRGAFGILCSDSLDYAYLDAAANLDMLRHFWDVQKPEQLEAAVSDLERSEPNAWNLVRAMLLARAAVSPGWWSQEASWSRCFRLGRSLQAAYPSWQAMADDLLRSRRIWRDLHPSGGEDARDATMPAILRQLARMRAEVWLRAPWTTRLP